MDDYNPNYDRYPPPEEPNSRFNVIFWVALALAIELAALGVILYKVW